MSGTAPRVFVVRAGADGADEEFVLENNLAVVGFMEIGSLEHAASYEEVVKIVRSGLPDANAHKVGNIAGQLWAFALSMQEGDIVVLPRKLTSQVALGRVKGPYRYQLVGSQLRHTRSVEWIRPDLPRSAFGQDLLYSFGAFLTVCNISRNNAAARVAAVLAGKQDPGYSDPPPETVDLAGVAHDQIVQRIEARFKGHAMARLVDAVLRAEGWVTKVSPAGPDGGVDILAGRGSLGLDDPRLCVQVKSQTYAADVTVLRTLQGSMQTFGAKQGLLVCWGGFNSIVQREARGSHFTVRLWDAKDLVEAIYRTYDQLPAEIQAELPLKRVWVLVPEDSEE